MCNLPFRLQTNEGTLNGWVRNGLVRLSLCNSQSLNVGYLDVDAASLHLLQDSIETMLVEIDQSNFRKLETK
jgi:hypothetical protein